MGISPLGGGGDLAASGPAFTRGNVPGVKIFDTAIDATGDGASAGSSGKAEFNSVIPSSPTGGNIVIRAVGGGSTPGATGTGISVSTSAIVTGGNGSITLRGTGTPSQYSNRLSEGIFLEGAVIKSNSGNITLEGFKGTASPFGISLQSAMLMGATPMDRTLVNPFIGTNGAISISGDSLVFQNGNLGIYSGQASQITAPVIGLGSIYSTYGLTKTGPGVLTFSGDASTLTNLGSGRVVTRTGAFSDTNNTTAFSGVTRAEALYSFAQPVYLRLNSGLSSVYGEPTSFPYSLYDASTGGNAITDAVPTGVALWSGAPTANSSVGSYSVTYSSGISLGSSSYLLNTGAAVSYTITPKPITITADAKTKVYGEADPRLTYTVGAGLVGVDSFTGSLTREAGDTVGVYSISAFALTNPNYTVTPVSADLSITPKAITITADAKTKVYGEADPTLTYTIGAGLVGADTFTGSLTRAAGDTVGAYAISASALTNPNYTVTPVSADLSITPKPITITADAKTKVYGEADPRLTYTVGAGLVGVDSFTGSLTREAGDTVGVYSISAFALTNPNYTVTPVSADLSITPKAITITADAKTKVYGEADPRLTYTVGAGLVGVDSFTGSLTRAAGDTVGAYSINASALTNPNYTVTPVSADLSITPKSITITADAKTKVYGATDPTLTYTIGAGLVGADTFTVSLTREAGDTVGAYSINASALTNPNYTVTPVGGVLTINQRPITLTADAKTKVYGEVDPALTYRITSGNLLEGDAFTGVLTRAPGNNAGLYTISVADLANANYAITPVDSTLTISQPPVSATNAVGAVYIAPPTVARPAAAPVPPETLLVQVDPAPVPQSNEASATGAASLDTSAVTNRAPGTVLVVSKKVKTDKKKEEDERGFWRRLFNL